MADSIDPTGMGKMLFPDLLKEIKKGNASTRDLLREERDNDSPKSLFAGNMFEIFNARGLQTSQRKFEKTKGIYDVDDILSDSLSAIDESNQHLDEVIFTLMEGFDGLANLLGMGILKRDDVAIFSEAMLNAQDPTIKAIEDLSQGQNESADILNGSKSRDKESEKDEDSENKSLFGGVTDSIKGFGIGIADGFKNLNDTMLGKVGFATVLIALGAFLVSKFPLLAEAVGTVTKAFVKLFKTGGRVMDPEDDYGLFDFFRDNFFLFLGLTLYALKFVILKQIGKLVIFLSKKFGKFLVRILKKVLLRALITMLTVGIGAAIGVGGGIITLIIGAIAAAIGGIVGAVMGLFDEFTREYKASGSILKALGAGLLGILKGALAGVVFVLEKIISFVTFGLLDFDFASIIMDFDMGGMVRDVFQKIKDFIADFSISDALSSIGNLFSGDGEKVEGKYMGGSVASGTPYIVGEQGPELFVPGASGSIVPNGAMGGSGAPIIVTNNNINAPTSNSNHQHSNISITDNQQEITGL